MTLTRSVEVIQVEPGLQFRLPLADEVLRGQDQDVGFLDFEQMLADYGTCLDCLAQTYLVREDVSLQCILRHALNNRELMGIEVH